MIPRLSRALALPVILAVGALGAASGAAAQTAWAPVVTAGGSARTVTVSPPTASVSAHVGDTVVVQLTACAGSCGYVWKVTTPPKPSVVRYLSTTFKDQTPAGLIGGNQTQSVSYRAVGAGMTSATFSYFPPGTGATATQKYVLTFRITDPRAFTTAPKTRTAIATSPVQQLWRIRTGNDGYFDRVVFDERNGTSGYLVKYVTKVVADGSGLPVKVNGRYFLQVTMYSTSTRATIGAPTYVPSVLNPHLPLVMQVKKTGEFEKVVTFAIGLPQYEGFRVLQLTSPNRLVVDVHH